MTLECRLAKMKKSINQAIRVMRERIREKETDVERRSKSSGYVQQADEQERQTFSHKTPVDASAVSSFG